MQQPYSYSMSRNTKIYFSAVFTNSRDVVLTYRLNRKCPKILRKSYEQATIYMKKEPGSKLALPLPSQFHQVEQQVKRYHREVASQM